MLFRSCEFDLPEYSHWLRQPYSRRQQDLSIWIGAIRPVCDAVTEVLWLIRESALPIDKLAIDGMYKYNMQKDEHCRLLRINLINNSSLYPEISGSQHRFTVRFLERSEEHTSELQSRRNLVCRLLLEKKNPHNH